MAIVFSKFKKNLSQIKIPLKNTYSKFKLNRILTKKCNVNNLLNVDKFDLNFLLKNENTHKEWESILSKQTSYQIPDISGGANFGDRRALFYITRYLRPTKILEIGTHIGASTFHLATALALQNSNEVSIDTVDIIDVNDPQLQPWLNYKVTTSPEHIFKMHNLDKIVRFITISSIEFLKTTKNKYDLIFLDGSHEAEIVYQEVPLALELLNKNGAILLHDYFPDSKPLWDNKLVIPGPYLAIKRLISEGADVSILPLGSLPWPTKVDSNITSLAILLKK